MQPQISNDASQSNRAIGVAFCILAVIIMAGARTSVGSRQGLGTVLSNVSSATGRPERIAVFTTLLRDGGLFYVLGVAPGDRYAEYEGTFRRVVKSIQIMD